MSGHWFCETCDDVVPNNPKPLGRYDSLANVLCPVCHHETMFWVKDVPQDFPRAVSPTRAAELFAQMRREFNPGDAI